MGIRNVVGQAVRNEDYFHRPIEEKKLRNVISSGSHVLISAPRRVGKTSLMFYLMDNPCEGCIYIYLITQSIYDSNAFYQKLHTALLDSGNVDDTIIITKKAKKMLASIIGQVDKVTVTAIGGVELKDGKEPNYQEECRKILSSLNMKGNKLVIMIDEFPQTVENIREKSETEAIRFLQQFQELTKSPNLFGKVQFILTGSIGLENVVSRMQATKYITDLNSHPVGPLLEKEGVALIMELVEKMDFDITEDVALEFLDLIKWNIPFYIQLLVQELNNLYLEEPFTWVDGTHFGKAFENAIKNRSYFLHWEERLRKSFQKDGYKLAVEILDRIATRDTLSGNEIHDLAVKHSLEEDYKEVLRTLIYDGYINNDDDHAVYRFNSPLLQAWWRKNVTN
ncbi:MAG: ATP-binding protein [Nitrospinae bacterium]|nr:ATP-binding protein [Nitrospinota bacterium]